jgi:GntR family transcriptional repressor for pyruvate dehydrogenase complex
MATSSGRKADRVAEDLLRHIVSGELAPGATLPTGDELATAYGVNRSVIREAVKQLEVQRVVQPIKRRGTVVLDPLGSPSPDVLWAMLEPQPGVIDAGTLADLLEIRAVLDVEMSGLAAQRRDDDDIAAMDAILEGLRLALGQPDRYARLMDEMSLATARATKNRIYLMLVHWHRRLRGDHDPLQAIVRSANEAHLSGVRFLVDLIRQREAEQARAFIGAVHEWLAPRMMAAAALSSGEPLNQAIGAMT